MRRGSAQTDQREKSREPPDKKIHRNCLS